MCGNPSQALRLGTPGMGCNQWNDFNQTDLRHAPGSRHIFAAGMDATDP
jgi:hypothetical protein